MPDDDWLHVDDLVTGKAAEQLGEGRIATDAILLVETIGGPEDRGFRYVTSRGINSRLALGMLRSALLKFEADDVNNWDDDDD